MKTNKGISLVALIITIIVMVILAGIIIVSAVSDGGVIDRAQKAMKENERAEVEDLVIASYVYKTTASTTSAGHLNLEETAKAIYLNLTDNNFKLKTSAGQDATSYEGIYSQGATSINLNVEGKRGSYEGTVEKTGLKDGMKIVEDNNGGNGTALEDDSNPLTIGAIEDLVELALTVNSGTSYEGQTITLLTSLDFNSADSYRTQNPELTKYTDKEGNEVDINGDGIVEPIMTELTTGLGFMPIGKYIGDDEDTGMPIINAFRGIFDGNGKTISNIYMNRPEGFSTLFGIDANTIIKNLTISEPEIYGNYATGIAILVGINAQETDVAKIEDCHILGGRIGAVNENCISQYSAGIVYAMTRGGIDIKGSTNSSNIYGLYSAGLGYLYCMEGKIKVENCINEGDVVIDDLDTFLATLGNNDSHDVSGCVVAVSPKGSTVINCKNYGELNGIKDSNIAGVVSGTGVYLKECENYGRINVTNLSGKEPSANIAGIYYDPGYDDAIDTAGGIENCINYGNINITGEYMSYCEIAGISSMTYTDGNIKSCINKGNINVALSSTEKSLYDSEISGIAHTDKDILDCVNYGNINITVGKHSTYLDVSGVSCYANQIVNCANYGNINADNCAGISHDSETYWADTKIYNCYNIGNIKGYYKAAGIGINTTINNVYNLGNITSDEASCSIDEIALESTKKNYYLQNGTESIDEKKNLKDLLNSNIGENTDWSQWKIDSNLNNGYPVFSWQNVE